MHNCQDRALADNEKPVHPEIVNWQEYTSGYPNVEPEYVLNYVPYRHSEMTNAFDLVLSGGSRLIPTQSLEDNA